MSDLSRTKMESHKLLEGIDKLRNIEPAFRSAFVEDRDDDSTGGSNIAGVSSYLAENLTDKASHYRDEATRLLCKHAKLISSFSAYAGWERNGVAMCCECGEIFFIEELRGSFMDRHCPLCGCRLHEGAYDAHAKALVHKAEDERRDSDGDDVAEIEEELDRLAMARYLTSEWYLLTGVPTSEVGLNATQEGYSFTPVYNKVGRFFLRLNYGKHKVLGIRGEVALFDSLRMRVNNRYSPLYGAKIVPNINLVTNDIDEHGRLRVKKNQTDCILLVPTGAFIFEVKRWRAKIRVHAPQREIEVTRCSGLTKYRSDEGPVAQVKAARKSLLGHCDGLRSERLCSVIAFADPLELTGDVGDLPCEKGVFFGWVESGGKSSIRKEIEDCVIDWEMLVGNRIDGDISDIAARLLSENSCYALPIDPIGRR